MKHLIAAAVLAISTVPLLAQPELINPMPVTSETKYTLRLGPTLGFVAGGVATENAEGRKVNPNFHALPNYGIGILAPFGAGSRIGMRLDLAVESVSMRTRPYEFFGAETDWNGYVVERYDHFTIAPVINFSGFFVGAGIHIPMKGTVTSSDGNTEYVVEKGALQTAIDMRLGGTIGVWHSKLGTLNVELMASYYFTGLYNEDRYMYGRGSQPWSGPSADFAEGSNINLIPGRVSIGASYLFNLDF